MPVTLSETDAQQSDAFAERLFNASLGMFDILAAYIGERLGFYHALADGGPATSAELAARAGCEERYVREWLEQQAVSGVLEASDGDAMARRYTLPASATLRCCRSTTSSSASTAWCSGELIEGALRFRSRIIGRSLQRARAHE